MNKDICKIQNIAGVSGFSWKFIQDVLTEMTAAGFTATSGGEKRGRHYFLKSPEKIKNLFDVQNLYFPDWRRIFDILGIIGKLLPIRGWQAYRNKPSKANSDEYLKMKSAKCF